MSETLTINPERSYTLDSFQRYIDASGSFGKGEILGFDHGGREIESQGFDVQEAQNKFTVEQYIKLSKDDLLDMKNKGFNAAIRASGRGDVVDTFEIAFTKATTDFIREHNLQRQVHEIIMQEALQNEERQRLAGFVDMHEDTGKLHFHVARYRHAVDEQAKTISKGSVLTESEAQFRNVLTSRIIERLENELAITLERDTVSQQNPTFAGQRVANERVAEELSQLSVTTRAQVQNEILDTDTTTLLRKAQQSAISAERDAQAKLTEAISQRMFFEKALSVVEKLPIVETQLKQLEVDNAVLVGDLQKANNEKELLAQENSVLSDNLTQTNLNNQDLQEQVTNLSGEVEQGMQQLELAEKDLAQAQYDLEQKNVKLAETTNKLVAAENRADTAEARLSTSEKLVEDMGEYHQKQMQDMQQKLEAAENRAAQAENKVVELEKEATGFRAMIERLNAKVAEQAQQLQEQAMDFAKKLGEQASKFADQLSNTKLGDVVDVFRPDAAFLRTVKEDVARQERTINAGLKAADAQLKPLAAEGKKDEQLSAAYDAMQQAKAERDALVKDLADKRDDLKALLAAEKPDTNAIYNLSKAYNDGLIDYQLAKDTFTDAKDAFNEKVQDFLSKKQAQQQQKEVPAMTQAPTVAREYMSVDTETFLKANLSKGDLEHGMSGANTRLDKPVLAEAVDKAFGTMAKFDDKTQESEGFLFDRVTNARYATQDVVDAYKKAIDDKKREIEQRPNMIAAINATMGNANALKPIVTFTDRDFKDINDNVREQLKNVQQLAAPTVAPTQAPTVLTGKQLMAHIDNKQAEPSKTVETLTSGTQIANVKILQDMPDSTLKAGDNVLVIKGQDDKEAFIVTNEKGVKFESGDKALLNEVNAKIQEMAKENDEHRGR